MVSSLPGFTSSPTNRRRMGEEKAAEILIRGPLRKLRLLERPPSVRYGMYLRRPTHKRGEFEGSKATDDAKMMQILTTCFQIQKDPFRSLQTQNPIPGIRNLAWVRKVWQILRYVWNFPGQNKRNMGYSGKKIVLMQSRYFGRKMLEKSFGGDRYSPSPAWRRGVRHRTPRLPDRMKWR